jgi:fructose-bisphosphate aldolase, class I
MLNIMKVLCSTVVGIMISTHALIVNYQPRLALSMVQPTSNTVELHKYATLLAQTHNIKDKYPFDHQKGILAADESFNTIGSRFKGVGLENTASNRREYRHLLFTTPGLSKYITGTILFEETMEDKELVHTLLSNNIVPGIKVDKGVHQLIGGYCGETITIGLDDLDYRCERYHKLGAKFSKWRSIFRIPSGGGKPSNIAIKQNIQNLAIYAKISQSFGLVPLVEPEILMDGCHSIETTYSVACMIYRELFYALSENNVEFSSMLLKPSFIVAGADWSISNDDSKLSRAQALLVAEYTLELLQNHLPTNVPGAFFLSGGLTDHDASIYLNVLNTIPRKGPWTLSFSYGRALQQACLNVWRGDKTMKMAAQTALLARAENNARAVAGKYVGINQLNLNV